MSDSNRDQWSYSRESTWGTTPAGNPFTEIPIVDGAMPHGQETVRSQTLRSDAQLADSKRVGLAPAPNFNFELAARLYDPFLRDAIRSNNDWTTEVNIAGTDIAAESSGNQYTSTTTSFNDVNLAIGQWVYVAGFTTAANNGWKKVAAISTYALTVTGGTLSDEAAGDSVTMKGAYIWNGTGKGSYSLQRNFADLTNRWHITTGCRINSFSLEQTPGGIITGALAFDGKQRAQAAAGGGTGVVTAAASEDVVTEVDGFENVWIDNAVISSDVMGLNLSVSIPNRPAKALGSLPRTQIELGSPEITGSINLYLDDTNWAYDGDYEDFTKFSLAFDLDMQGGDRYLIELPQCAFTGEPGSNPGIDNDLMLDFEFAAEPGGTFGATSLEKTIQICRLQA